MYVLIILVLSLVSKLHIRSTLCKSDVFQVIINAILYH